MLNSIILRNEPFGGVYFNQQNGRTIMMDQEGFISLLKHLKKEPVTQKEEKFNEFFFNTETPKNIKFMLNRSTKFIKDSPLVTTSPTLIDLSLNNYCNLSCSYCYMSAKKMGKGEDLSMENFEFLLSEMKKNRVLQIALGGGEPTLHPHFTEILKLLRIESDIIPNYTTNGTNLIPVILDASKEYCGAVAVSYSEEREEETQKAVKTLTNHGIQTNIHIVLLKSRIPKLSEITEKYAKLGIHSVVLLLFKPIGRGENLTYEILTPEDKKSFASEVMKVVLLRQKYGVRLSIDACSAFAVKDFPFLPESIDGCTGGTYSAYIDWNLNMKTCSFMQNNSGVDVKTKGIIGAWKSEIFNKFREMILNPRYEGCKACESFSSCWGGCPIKPELNYCEVKGEGIL